MTTNLNSTDIASVAKFMLAGAADNIDAAELAMNSCASIRVQNILKAGVAAGTTSNYDALSDWRTATAGFFLSMRGRSIFFRLIDSGFKRIPLRTRIAAVSMSATAWISNEAKPRALSKLTLANPELGTHTASALMVITDEVARSLDPAAINVINSELRGAVADVVDEHFFSLMIDSATPAFASTGTGLDGMKQDLFGLLSAVNSKGVGQLIWAMSPDVGNMAAVLDDRNEMTPLGGELLGLPAAVSPAIPSGTIRLLDAGSIAANADRLELAVSRNASIEMETDPTNASDVPTAAELVSMFQTNAAALLCRVSFGAEKIRDAAIAEMIDVEWITPASA